MSDTAYQRSLAPQRTKGWTTSIREVSRDEMIQLVKTISRAGAFY